MKKYRIGIRSEKSVIPLDCMFRVIGENPLAYHFHSEMGRFDFWVHKGYLAECTAERKSLDSRKLECFVEKDIF